MAFEGSKDFKNSELVSTARIRSKARCDNELKLSGFHGSTGKSDSELKSWFSIIDPTPLMTETAFFAQTAHSTAPGLIGRFAAFDFPKIFPEKAR